MSRANFCKLRFKSKGFSKIMALGGDIKSPGQVIYYSEERKNTEHAAWINTTKEAIDFMKKHPEYKADYYRYKHLERTSTMPTIETQQRQSAEEYYQPLSVDSPRLSAKKGPGYEGRNKHVNRKGYDNNLYGQEDGKSANRYRPAYSDARNYNDAYNKGVYDDGDSQYDALYPNNRKFSQINSGYDTGDADDVNLFDYLRQHIPPEYLYKKQSFPETPRQNDRTQPRYQNSKLSHQSATKRFPPPYKRSLSASEAELKIPRNADDLLQRKRRHIGPHDNSGLQRLISTGTLAPTTLPTSHSDFNRSIDYIFGVYWFFPVKSQAILPEDQKCIANKMAEETIRFNKDSKYYGLDHDGYEHKITDECLDKNGNKEKDNSKYRHQNSYNPYDLKMGQMTVYRMRLICRCNQTSANLAGKKCATVLPFEQQQWPAYMGRDADSHWLPRIIKQTKSNNDS